MENKRSRLKITDKVSTQVIVDIIIIFSVVFSMLPLLITILNSFKSNYDIVVSIFSLPSSGIEWGNYTTAFNVICSGMIRSVFVALVASLSVVFLGSVIAYIFARKQFVAKEFFFMIYITVLLMPAIVGMPVLYALMYKLNIIDTYFAMWLPLISSSQVGALFLFRTFFEQQPASVFEAAKIDGANDIYVYFQIVLPLALPILALIFVSVFTAQYNDFLWPSLVIKSESKMMLMTILQRSSEIFATKQEGDQL